MAASLETSFFSGAGLFTFLEGIPGYLLPSVCKLVILACLSDILQRMSYFNFRLYLLCRFSYSVYCTVVSYGKQNCFVCCFAGAAASRVVGARKADGTGQDEQQAE